MNCIALCVDGREKDILFSIEFLLCHSNQRSGFNEVFRMGMHDRDEQYRHFPSFILFFFLSCF